MSVQKLEECIICTTHNKKQTVCRTYVGSCERHDGGLSQFGVDKTKGVSLNILVTSHSTLCTGLISAYEMLVSPDAHRFSAVSLTDRGIGDFRARLVRKFAELSSQGNVLILADLPGGTPYNEGNMLFQQHQDTVRLVAGVNFPMLAEVGLYAKGGDDLDEAVRIAVEAGRAGVVEALPLDDTGNDSDEDLF